jgi:hypothetical protein
MEEILPNKGILKKLTRREELGLLYSYQQSWNPKQAITLKHIISYSNLRTYINPKGMIGMPVTGYHVWGHAYKHDKHFAHLRTKLTM